MKGINREELIDVYREAIKNDVPLEWMEEKQAEALSKGQKQKRRAKWRDLPFVIVMLLGVGFIVMALAPSLSYFWRSGINEISYKLGIVSKNGELIAPIPSDQVLGINTVLAKENNGEEGLTIRRGLDGEDNSEGANGQEIASGPVMLDEQLDFRNLANWFNSTDNMFNNHGIGVVAAEGSYTLDIPKLNVKNAKIKIGGTNLDSSLIQYETTSMPGEYGGPVIFGHSTLRQWYSPGESNPERYMSIFSTIMTLEKGDKIYLNKDGLVYTYQVISKQNVKPDEREKLIGQDESGKFLKLITCTPEGTTAMRGIVTAVLVTE